VGSDQSPGGEGVSECEKTVQGGVTERDIIATLVRHIYYPLRWAVCPNVSFGFGLPYEADIIAISKSMRIHEVEVKITKADLLADARKYKWQRGLCVDAFWYAVPESIRVDAINIAKERRTGLYIVDAVRDHVEAVLRPLRQKVVKAGGPPERDRRNRIWRLAAFRFWHQEFNRLDDDVRANISPTKL